MSPAVPVMFRSVLALSVPLLVMSVVSLVAGCAMLYTDSVRYNVIDYPTPGKDSESPIPETLMVYRFLLANSVDLHNLVVISPDGVEEKVSLQRWQFDPSDMVTELIQRDIEASGLFEKTVDQWSSARYRYALEGKIGKLEGVSEDGKTMAVLQAEATLTDFETPIGAKKNIMKNEYTIRVPSVDSKPMSIVRAMNLAVRELSEKIRADIAASLATEGESEIQPDGPERHESVVRISSSSSLRANSSNKADTGPPQGNYEKLFFLVSVGSPDAMSDVS